MIAAARASDQRIGGEPGILAIEEPEPVALPGDPQQLRSLACGNFPNDLSDSRDHRFQVLFGSTGGGTCAQRTAGHAESLALVPERNRLDHGRARVEADQHRRVFMLSMASELATE